MRIGTKKKDPGWVSIAMAFGISPAKCFNVIAYLSQVNVTEVLQRSGIIGNTDQKHFD